MSSILEGYINLQRLAIEIRLVEPIEEGQPVRLKLLKLRGEVGEGTARSSCSFFRPADGTKVCVLQPYPVAQTQSKSH
jgi:hypothetical protein